MKILDKFVLKFYIRLHNFLYRQISKTSSRLNNGLNPKHQIMRYYNFFLENVEKDSKVLDVGCGNGFVAYKIAQKAHSVFAIDINKSSIELAKRKYNRKNIEYINSDILNYEFEEKFDYIILSNILEHIKDRKEFLNKIKPLSKFLLVRVPMINRSWLPIYKKQLGYEYRLDSTHYIEYTFKTFKQEIEGAGLQIIFHSVQFGEIWAKIGLNNAK